MSLSANGFKVRDVSTSRVPQPAIWDRYAQLYQFYQVESVHLEFYPFKWETTASTVGATVNTVFARPAFSCIDPDGVEPVGASAVASYCNLMTTPAYATHKRGMGYSALGIEK